MFLIIGRCSRVMMLGQIMLIDINEYSYAYKTACSKATDKQLSNIKMTVNSGFIVFNLRMS